MNGVALTLGLLMSCVIGLVLAWPWLVPSREQGDTRVNEPTIHSRRESLLSALRDLDFDHSLGQVADEDYGPMRQTLLRQAAALQVELDRQSEATAMCSACDQLAQIGDQYCSRCGSELAGARSRCPACAGPFGPDDLYCRSCGLQLVPAQRGTLLNRQGEAVG